MASIQKIEVKIEFLCRTCLSKENELYSLFDEYMGGIALDHIVTSITGLKISKGDGFPSTICNECKDKAEKAFVFKKRSEDAHISLKALFDKEKKDFSLPTSTQIFGQTIVTKIKTEDLFMNDNDEVPDDYIDSGPDFDQYGSDNEEDEKYSLESLQEGTIENSEMAASKRTRRAAATSTVKIETDARNSSNTLILCPFCRKYCYGAGHFTKHLWKWHQDDMNSGPKKRGRGKKKTIDAVKKYERDHDEEFKSNHERNKRPVSLKTKAKDEQQKNKLIKVENEEVQNSLSLCPLCGACYYGAENLTKHMLKYHPDVMGPKKRGRPKKVMTSTILNKLSENGFRISPLSANKFECMICKQSMETKESLDEHIVTHKDHKILSCVFCKKMYLDKIKYDQHICSDGKTAVNDLDVTNGDSSDTRQLSFHSEITVLEILGPNPSEIGLKSLNICSACTRVFLSDGDLTSHHDDEHPELSLRCNLCNKVFATLRTAARHRSVCKQIERKHKCTTCGLKFAYEISLNKHILRYHEGQSVSVKFIDPKTKREERQFQCDTCNRCFYKRELLVKHTKIHMSSEKNFQCDVCEKKFHRRDNLRSHQRIHQAHREKAPNTCLCLYCGRSFSNSSNLIVHIRRHTGEKPYKCDFCGKGFPRSSDLQCHRRSHTGEKPCVCRVCGKGFSRSNKLSRHMRVHTGQRPYKCTYCDKAFSQSNDLTLHIRRHTGDRPYICEICGDRFIQGTALQNHRRAHGHFPPTVAEPAPVIHTLAYTVQTTNHTTN